MEHHMIYDAKIKKHSTFTEAIEEGRTVGADFIMLTHFSQRYSKLPVLEEMKDQPRVGIAFDMMEVRPSTMHLIPALYPALSRHFATYMQEMAERTHQYKVNSQVPIYGWSRPEAFVLSRDLHNCLIRCDTARTASPAWCSSWTWTPPCWSRPRSAGRR